MAGAKNLSLVKAPDDRHIDEARPYYVFNAEDNGGFVIVGGDSRVQKILGYSDSGCFDFDNVPPALAWMLSVYDKYIENLSDETVKSVETDAETGRENISPLLTSRWSQGEPYNSSCPVIGENRASTGCVATAVAQIVNYHKWPDCGEGTFSYLWNDKTLSYDYNANPFD